jgi:hypothetical protein
VNGQRGRPADRAVASGGRRRAEARTETEAETEMGTETKTETRTEARIRIRTWGQVLSDGVHKLLGTDLRWAMALIIYSHHNPYE